MPPLIEDEHDDEDDSKFRSSGLVKLALSPQTAGKEQRRAQDLPHINPKAEDER